MSPVQQTNRGSGGGGSLGKKFGGVDGDGKKRDGSEADGSSAKQAGAGVMGGGLALDIMSIMGNSKAEKKAIKSQSDQEIQAAQLTQRSDFGTMIAQGGSSGLTTSSFESIFNAQTIEDAKQITQLKQDRANRLAASKTKKHAAITSSIMGTAKQAATLGMSG